MRMWMLNIRKRAIKIAGRVSFDVCDCSMLVAAAILELFAELKYACGWVTVSSSTVDSQLTRERYLAPRTQASGIEFVLD